MNLLLDFIETEFGLLPVESPGWSITFLPPLAAVVGTALWDTSIWVSPIARSMSLTATTQSSDNSNTGVSCRACFLTPEQVNCLTSLSKC